MKRPITVPYHQEIARGTLGRILKDAEIDVADFIRVLT